MSQQQILGIVTPKRVLEGWQRIAWEKHRKECKQAKLQDIHLYGQGVSISPTTLDTMLQASGLGPPIWSPQEQHHPTNEDAHEEHRPSSSPSAFLNDDEKSAGKEQKDESAFSATERIVAGQCTCCNTLFQLEILEKVGTIKNADIELRKLQNSIPLQQKEIYGSMNSGAGADYAPRSNEEVKIMYTTGTPTGMYTHDQASVGVRYNAQDPITGAEYK